MDLTKSYRYLAEAEKYFPGGLQTVRHPRSLIEGEYPVYIEKGKGAHVWDVDGNEYIDFIQGFGPTTIGIAIDEIDSAAIERIHKGICFGQANGLQIELAKKIQKYYPYAERLFFCKTGTDATTASVRLARAYTGKEILLTDGYHGWSDTFQYGADAGVLDCVRKKTRRIPFGDFEGYEAAVKEGNVACIMITPYMALPMQTTKINVDFIKKIRELCTKYNVPLIFDEVRTAFRFAMGGMSEIIDIQPDIIAFGKAFANGYSIAAIGGREEMMRPMGLAGKPDGTYISSTYFPNCLEMAVAIKVIDYYEKNNVIEKIHESGKYLLSGLKRIATELDAPVVFDDAPAMPAMMFDYSKMTEDEYFARTFLLYTYMIRCGIIIHPFRQMYITYSHSKDDLDKVIVSYREGLRLVRESYPW